MHLLSNFLPFIHVRNLINPNARLQTLIIIKLSLQNVFASIAVNFLMSLIK